MKFLVTLLTLVLAPVFALALAMVDLNSASVAQIQALPGVGQKTAEAIVAARPFKTVDDLKNVKGIGEAKFAAIKGMVTTGTTPAATTAATAPAMPQAATNTVAAQQAAAQTVTTAAKTGAKAKALAGQTININSASEAELAKLPGIGDAKAKSIIAARPFTSVDQLAKVKGIKAATIAKIRPYVTVQ